MEPEQQPPEQENEEDQEQLAQLEQAHLLAGQQTPVSPRTFLPTSTISETSTMLDLLQTLVLRVNQVANSNAEQFTRVEATLEAMSRTMELARIMIAEQDRQATTLHDLLVRLENVVAALVKVNANLSEIMAAILGPAPTNQKA